MEEVNKLYNELNELNRVYRNGNDTGVSDIDYDKKKVELTNLIGTNVELMWMLESLEQDLSAKVDDFVVKHSGLKDAFNEQEVIENIANDTNLIVSSKYDGLTALIYITKGVVTKVFTGGRKTGVPEDVTDNFIKRTNWVIPKRVAQLDMCCVKAEAILTYTEAERSGYSSARSGASGALRSSKKSADTVNITVKPFDIITPDDLKLSMFDKYIMLKMNTTEFRQVKSIEDIKKFYEEQSIMNDIPKDGIVIRSDNFDSSIEPFAYKFVETEHVVKILNIRHQVGRTGKLTPVAETEEWFSSDGGVNTNVTLSNYSLFPNAGVGSTISVIKSGAVIPKIEKVIESSKMIDVPLYCPSCGGSLIEYLSLTYCENALNGSSCPESFANKLVHFTSSIGVKGLAYLSAKELIESNLDIHNLYDFVTSLGRLHEVLGENGNKLALDIFNKRGNISEQQLIVALGIINIGNTAFELIFEDGTNNIRDMFDDPFSVFDYKSLTNINGVGSTISENLESFFSNDYNKDITKKLWDFFTPVKEVLKVNEASAIKDMAIVITGNYIDSDGVTYDRNEFKDLIKRNGASLKSSVSGKTDLVVEGEAPGSAKLRDAKLKGIRIVNNDEFSAMLK